jgi:hypothetical protein
MIPRTIARIERWDKAKVRNDQVGDWVLAGDSITVLVVDGLPPESELMVGVHELMEAFLCRRNGISDSAVNAFDALFEEERRAGKHSLEAEAGDDPRAPYFKEHQMATFVERAACHALDFTWVRHEQAVSHALGITK